jgi:hypothetical protein
LDGLIFLNLIIMNTKMYGAIDPKKKGSTKINVDSTGATPKTYPKTRTETQDKLGNKITTINDSTKKMLFSGKSNSTKAKEAVQGFRKDSTQYANAADYDAKDYNNKKAYANAQAFASKKK